MGRVVRGQQVSATLREAARRLQAQQTLAERRLWERLRAGRLDGRSFRRQQPIGPYIVDFYCSAAKLIVEVDGPIHDEQVEYDRERDAYLVAYGLYIMRFTNGAVMGDLDAILIAIRHATAIA